MDDEKKWLDWFYYAAPLWLALETFVWPDFRAGVITGGAFRGNAAFYCVEWGLGAALYFELPYARLSALIENAALTILYLKFILFAPWDIASNLAYDPAGASAASYAAALPGALYSCLHVVLRLRSGLDSLGGKLNP